MVEMGIFRTTIGIESPERRGHIQELADALVDTGSELTWIPRALLESLGIKSERRQGFVVADGRTIERDIGYAIVHAGGVATIDDIVFAEPGDFVLLGGTIARGTESQGRCRRQATSRCRSSPRRVF